MRMLALLRTFKPLAMKLSAREVGPTTATSSGWLFSNCAASFRPSSNTAGYTHFSWSPVEESWAYLATASATRRGSGQSPPCARKILWAVTGNSWWRNSSLASSSVKVILKLHRVSDVLEMSHPESDDPVGNHEDDRQINCHGRPAGHGTKLA